MKLNALVKSVSFAHFLGLARGGGKTAETCPARHTGLAQRAQGDVAVKKAEVRGRIHARSCFRTRFEEIFASGLAATNPPLALALTLEPSLSTPQAIAILSRAAAASGPRGRIRRGPGAGGTGDDEIIARSWELACRPFIPRE
ncbi:MAG TPA: hypothetical protein VHC42_05405 [Rhizomicrobium sp.]|jgi:hypothetical protein|nr:hypothetical protein [Rhizomicrobium sp.]